MLQMKKLGFWLNECCKPCLVSNHLDRCGAKNLINNSSFDATLIKLQSRAGPQSVREIESVNAFEIMDDIFALGICSLKFALMNIDNLITDDEDDGRKEIINDIANYLRMSKDCFHAILKILRDYETNQRSDLPWKFYKFQCACYMVDTGNVMLKLRAIMKSHDLTNTELIKWTEELFKKAIDVFNDVDPEGIKRNKINLRLAQTYLACNKLPNALKEAQIAKNLNPLDYEERKVLGEIFCKLEEYKHGLSELNVALSYKPDDSEILFCTGRAYFSAGKDCKRKGEERNWILKNAREKLEEALDIADRSEVRYRGKIRFWIGRTLLETGNYEEAIPHLRILAEKDETDFLPALYLGYTFLKCNYYEECERCLYKLIRSIRSNILDKSDKAKLRRRTRALSCRASEAPPHEAGTKLICYKPRLNTHALYHRCKHRGITIKIKKDKKIIGEFYGQEYYEKRHINEILARAYIYLAYSYAKRDANLCDSWRLAYESQFYVDNLREEPGHEKERARDGVLPLDKLIWDEVPGNDSKKLREFLLKISGLDWARNADIIKIENDKAIQVSHEDNSLSLVLDSNECKAFLKINGVRIYETRAIRENGNLMICLPDMSDISCMNHRLSEGYAIKGMNDFKIKIIFNSRDGMRKRKSKAHLAECAGTICYKMGNLDAAVDYLNASISLYPDAGAYLNLAKTYERMILQGVADNSKRKLLKRQILDLCRHVKALDIRDEQKEDLRDFRLRWPEEKETPECSAVESSDPGEKAGEDGTEETKKKNGK
jgi:tetratricopeptide (TPR) repeat protein